MKDVTERVDLPDGARSARRPPGRSVDDNAGVPGAARPTPRTLTRRGVLRLQRSAGNAAVSRLVAGARGPAAARSPGRAGQNGGTTAGPGLHGAAAGTGAPTREVGGPVTPPGMTDYGGPPGVLQRRADEHPSPPPEPTPVKPESDPRFAKVTKQTTATAAKLRAHPPAKGEAAKAAKAAVPPAGHKDAQAKAAKADKMGGAKPGGFDKAAFMAAVRSAIAAKAPKNLEEADEFSESGKADGVKAEVMGKVTQGKDASAKDIATKTAEAPDPSKAKDKPVTPLTPDQAVAPPAPDTAAAMPAEAPPEQTDLGAGKAETDQELAAADVSEEQLAKSNEPEFTDAVAAKKEGETHSATAPAKVRESEAATLQDAAAGADQSGKATVAGLIQSRAGAVSKVAGGKSEAKSKDEQARAKVAAEVKGIFDATKTDVDKILNDLDGKVATKFEQGEKAAKAAFTADHKARMERYKDHRYSGWRGKLRWAKDKLAGMPADANNLFLESKKLYEQKMDGVISDVADLIGTELTRAKDRIAKGRDQITKFVASQPKEVQKVAGDAAKDIGGKFDQLTQDVDDKQEALVDDLATRYTEARNAVDEEIKELQAANRGLWDKAKDAIGGAIKTILKLKDMLLGVLSRAAGAIGKIIKDPIGFLGNLISAVKGGVQNFGANIVEHLKKGMQAFLFGSLASAGIEIPETFDLKGIIKLVLSILGLTWTKIRTKIVKRIGDTAMGAVEKGVDIFKTLATEGVGGLWKFLVDKLSDLKDTVMDAIQDFVVVKIVKAGITWLISALNPAAAFIKACKMIYDVVMFFVEKGSQIKEFVDSVLDSIESIVGGGVGAVAKHIENTLAKILPLLIGFLASLLGLGGISEKVKEILGKVQKPVEKAVDAVINGALKLAAPIINLAKRGAKWVKGKYEKGKAWVKGKVEKGKAWARGKVDSAKAKLGLGPEETETKSKEVRAAVTRDLRSTIGGEVSDADTTMSAVQGVYNRHKADGLRALEIRSTGRAGEFEVLVTASPAAPALKFVFEDFKVGLSTTELEAVRKQEAEGTPAEKVAAGELRGRRMPMTETEKADPDDPTKVRKSPSGARGQQHTALVAFWNGVPTGRIQSSGKHAEDKLLTLLRGRVGTEGWPNKPDGNTLAIKITKSPCSVCGQLLTQFQREYRVSLALDMEAPHMDRTKTARGTVPKVKTQERRAMAVLKTMREEGAKMGLGVQLTAWNVAEILSEHYEGPDLDEREKEYVRNKVEKMQGILDRVNKATAALDRKKVSG